jgi:hypothetical protein
MSDRHRRAKEQYEEAVQRELIQPLQAWSMARPDPVLRNVGIELSDVCQLLHCMGPLLQNQQTRQFERALAGASEPLPTEALSQYLALAGRLSNLMRDLRLLQDT